MFWLPGLDVLTAWLGGLVVLRADMRQHATATVQQNSKLHASCLNALRFTAGRHHGQQSATGISVAVACYFLRAVWSCSSG